MNKLFKDDLIERLLNICDDVETGTQYLPRTHLKDEADWFPMLAFEENSDDNSYVEFEESNFLTSPLHQGFWIVGWNEDDISFIFNLKEHNRTLEIDALEVNRDKRGGGLGGNLVSIIESVAEHYYDDIMISPFDTSAMNFWEHMEYEEGNNGYWIKTL